MIEANRRISPTPRGPGLLAKIVGAETRLQTQDALQGYLFLTPWIIGLLVFFGGPVLASIVLSFTEYDILSTARFAGLQNYQRALFRDSLFWPSLGRTLYYSAVVVPISLIGSLLLAVLLNQHLVGTNILRTVFFVPHLTPIVAVAVIWSWLLHAQLGPVNALLGSLGLHRPGWFTTRTYAIPSLIIISTWMQLGGNRMLIFLAGLQGVPEELYEAAELDGAGAFRRFWHVTLPMITPTIFLNLILGIISAMKVFGLAFVTTQGGPSYATWFFALHIYQQAFKYYRLGYGSALSWFFAIILIGFTMIQMRLSKRWVYYAGGN